MPKNTGTPGLPRNVGIQFARGKYIAFLDSDDLYTKTALEELTTLAEQYQADVLKLGANFILWDGQAKSEDDPAFTDMNEIINPKNFRMDILRKEQLVTPTFEPEDIGERIRRWVTLNSFWATWLAFYRRDFLITNQILFSAIKEFEDCFFTFEAFCLAKKYLNIANVTYIVRPRIGSACRDIPDASYFQKRLVSITKGCGEFKRIMERVPFFQTHPDYRYAMFDLLFAVRFPFIAGFYEQVPPFVLAEIVKQEFNPDDAELSAYLFNTVNIHRLQLIKLQQENIALRNELQKYQTLQ